ncbi:hypothetical protein HaLaN_11651 [Haematococcus lacustris]|uniref:Uncharacterized protein n=1 Tax=Haematococcus lacustris TaxID=44745 RepID=A0A699Z992_HAELA|nr:hypothetical protein HaLaN_11651 [Haematococcus lacustris]
MAASSNQGVLGRDSVGVGRRQGPASALLAGAQCIVGALSARSATLGLRLTGHFSLHRVAGCIAVSQPERQQKMTRITAKRSTLTKRFNININTSGRALPLSESDVFMSLKCTAWQVYRPPAAMLYDVPMNPPSPPRAKARPSVKHGAHRGEQMTPTGAVLVARAA